METRSKIAVVLGIIILLVDVLWLYGSVFAYGGFAGRNLPYRNLTGNATATYPGFNSSRAATFRAGGDRNYLDIAYGLVILIADIVWLYLEVSGPKHLAKKK